MSQQFRRTARAPPPLQLNSAYQSNNSKQQSNQHHQQLNQYSSNNQQPPPESYIHASHCEFEGHNSNRIEWICTYTACSQQIRLCCSTCCATFHSLHTSHLLQLNKFTETLSQQLETIQLAQESCSPSPDQGCFFNKRQRIASEFNAILSTLHTAIESINASVNANIAEMVESINQSSLTNAVEEVDTSIAMLTQMQPFHSQFPFDLACKIIAKSSQSAGKQARQNNNNSSNNPKSNGYFDLVETAYFSQATKETEYVHGFFELLLDRLKKVQNAFNESIHEIVNLPQKQLQLSPPVPFLAPSTSNATGVASASTGLSSSMVFPPVVNSFISPVRDRSSGTTTAKILTTPTTTIPCSRYFKNTLNPYNNNSGNYTNQNGSTNTNSISSSNNNNNNNYSRDWKSPLSQYEPQSHTQGGRSGSHSTTKNRVRNLSPILSYANTIDNPNVIAGTTQAGGRRVPQLENVSRNKSVIRKRVYTLSDQQALVQLPPGQDDPNELHSQYRTLNTPAPRNPAFYLPRSGSTNRQPILPDVYSSQQQQLLQSQPRNFLNFAQTTLSPQQIGSGNTVRESSRFNGSVTSLQNQRNRDIIAECNKISRSMSQKKVNQSQEINKINAAGDAESQRNKIISGQQDSLSTPMCSAKAASCQGRESPEQRRKAGEQGSDQNQPGSVRASDVKPSFIEEFLIHLPKKQKTPMIQIPNETDKARIKQNQPDSKVWVAGSAVSGTTQQQNGGSIKDIASEMIAKCNKEHGYLMNPEEHSYGQSKFGVFRYVAIPKQLFEGEWLNGKRHGYGMGLSEDGSVYDGQWKDDVMSGKGRLIKPSGEVYEGEFEGGKQNGVGKVSVPDGSAYIGEWKDGAYHGRGRKVWETGSFYEGAFRNGVREGEGIFKWKNGSYYSGQFFGNQFHGEGTYRWVNGRTYIGGWKEGKMEGKARDVSEQGFVYEGEFKNDMKNGYGVYHFSENKKYEGNWLNDKPHGDGVLEENGVRKTGVWNQGILSVPGNAK